MIEFLKVVLMSHSSSGLLRIQMVRRKYFFSASLQKIVSHPQDPAGKDSKTIVEKCNAFSFVSFVP